MNASDKPNRKRLPRVAVVGRMNVGKSTLFNRLSESNAALVSTVEGTTRDVNDTEVNWAGKSFVLTDTGGFDVPQERKPDRDAVEVMHRELRGADVICFVVDAKTGLMPHDRSFAKVLRPLERPVILVINKMETDRHRKNVDPAFFELGFDQSVMTSARTGVGTGDLLDLITKQLPDAPLMTDQAGQQPVSVAIIGRPNVGKSSILNMLLQEDRAIVSDEPLTTRETHGTVLVYQQTPLLFLDTAGLRRPARVRSNRLPNAPLEKMSVKQSLGSLKHADLVILVVDVSEGLVRQDQRLARQILDAKANVIIVANKIDLVGEEDIESVTESIRKTFPMISWAPIVCTSATSGRGRRELLDHAMLSLEERRRRMFPEECEHVRKLSMAKHLPTRDKGTNQPSLKHFAQVGTNPPAFELLIGQRQSLTNSYVKFVERILRETYGFIGTPVTITVRSVDEATVRRAKEQSSPSSP